jgi:hypothetical protein
MTRLEQIAHDLERDLLVPVELVIAAREQGFRIGVRHHRRVERLGMRHAGIQQHCRRDHPYRALHRTIPSCLPALPPDYPDLVPLLIMSGAVRQALSGIDDKSDEISGHIFRVRKTLR